MTFERYLSVVPWWATSLQAVERAGQGEREQSFEVELAQPAQFVIASLTLAGGKPSPWPIGRLILHAGGDTWYKYQADERQYVDERSTLLVLNRMPHTHWRIDLKAGSELPVELNFMAFHPVRIGGSGSPPVPPAAGAPPPPPSGYCRPCKITTKALALAIAAAATLPALPAALITAVASYLGVTAVVAAAFIGSVLGDTADIIAEKLCVRVGLCP